MAKPGGASARSAYASGDVVGRLLFATPKKHDAALHARLCSTITPRSTHAHVRTLHITHGTRHTRRTRRTRHTNKHTTHTTHDTHDTHDTHTHASHNAQHNNTQVNWVLQQQEDKHSNWDMALQEFMQTAEESVAEAHGQAKHERARFGGRAAGVKFCLRTVVPVRRHPATRQCHNKHANCWEMITPRITDLIKLSPA